MTNTKVWFIVGAVAFITIVVWLGSLMGSNLIPNAPERPSIEYRETNTIWDKIANGFSTVVFPFQELGYFISLTFLSSSFSILGIILTILTIGVIWCIIEIIRGV
jgi:hypothetical protein